MKKIRIAQIGMGHDHAPAALNCLLTLSDIFEVVGYVFVDDGEQARKCVQNEQFKNLKRLTLEEAFAIPDLDAAVIETDDTLLTKYARLALERGLAVQMDKPGGQDEVEFNDALDYAKENNLVFHLGYMYRYNPSIKKAIEKVKAGELGEIYSIEAQMSCCLPEHKRAWLKNFRGGMINFLGCHLIDTILQIKGEPKEIIPLSTVSRPDLGGEDVGLAVFKYDNCTAVIKSNCMETGGPMRRKIVITGEKGTVEINPTEYPKAGFGSAIFTDIRTCLMKDDYWNCRPEPQTFGPYDRYEEMFTEFAQIVRGEIENPYTYEYEKFLHTILLKACGVK